MAHSQNWITIDKIKLPNKHYVSLRELTTSTTTTPEYLVELYYYKRYEDVETSIQLAELWKFTTIDDALECFCRFLPEYLEEVDQTAPPVYLSLIDHRVYLCREHISL